MFRLQIEDEIGYLIPMKILHTYITLVLLLASVLPTSSSAASKKPRKSSPAAHASATPGPSREAQLPFVIDVKPSFKGSEAALRQLEVGNRAGALKILRSAGASTGQDETRRRLLMASLELEGRNYAVALTHLKGAAQALPALSDHIALMEARAYLGLGEAGKAAVALEAIPSSSPLSHRAVQLMARAELDQRQTAAALRRLLPSGSVTPEVLANMPPDRLHLLGEALTQQGGRQAEALAVGRTLKVSYPLSGSAERADAWLETLAAKGSSLSPFTLEERLKMGGAYFAANLNEAALERLEPLVDALAKAKAADKLRCTATWQVGVLYQNLRKYSAAEPFLRQAVQLCDPDTAAKALYRLTRGELSSKRTAEGETWARALIKQYPTSSLADDALFIVGASQQDDGALDKALATFQEQIKLFPSGDMRAEAGWRIGWIAFRQGDLNTALMQAEGSLQGSRFLPSNGKPLATTLEKATPGGDDPKEPLPPLPFPSFADSPRLTREAYWRARWLELSGKTRREEAIAAYERVVLLASSDFYAVLAQQRLLTLAPAKAKKLKAEVVTLQGKNPTKREVLKLELLPIEMQRAVQLLKAGLLKLAFDELTPLRETPSQQPLLLAYLLEQTRRYEHSHRVMKPVLERSGQLAPSAANRAYYYYAFPTVYSELVRKACGPQELDPMLLTAIAREESTFDPDIRSWAGAIGLTQLMDYTAARMAKELGLAKPSRQDLTDPGLNLKLGAHYLKMLLKLFEGHVGLAVPSYNAGEGAVGKWLKAKNELPFDEFVEEIPYKQTRDYVKRVLSTYQTYHVLYRPTQPFVEVPLTLPKR